MRTEMSTNQANLGSRPGTDGHFHVSDQVGVTIFKSEPDPGSPKLTYRSS